jgi:hypothetical protein
VLRSWLHSTAALGLGAAEGKGNLVHRSAAVPLQPLYDGTATTCTLLVTPSFCCG